MDIRRREEILRVTALTTVTCSFMFVAIAAARAGPCTSDISKLETQIKLSASSPIVGATATQTIGAQLHHQPTPGEIQSAETKANADADAALDRARKADGQNDATGCREALRQARLLYGLERN